jgi:HEAT repeat protein
MHKLTVFFVFISLIAMNVEARNKTQGDKQFKDAIRKLESDNTDEIMYGIQTLAASGSPTAVGPLTQLLMTGPQNNITNSTIQALGIIGHPHSINILIEYLGHRRPDARIACLYALENYQEKRVTRAIENALNDSNPEVRATAALSLGKRQNNQTVDILFLAFKRGVYDAAISIGQIGNATHAAKLATYLGRNDIKVMLPGFDEFLRRPEFPTKAKIEILSDLFELAGPDVRRFAIAYKASFPPDSNEESDPLFKKVSQMVRQIQEE